MYGGGKFKRSKLFLFLFLFWEFLTVYLTFVLLFCVIDEVGAIVFDPGHESIRAGFAGEDTPKADVPSFACSESLKEEPMEISGSSATSSRKNRKLYLDSNSIMVPRANVEMINFMKDGMSMNNLFEVFLIVFFLIEMLLFVQSTIGICLKNFLIIFTISI